ncbi:hypothetical protein HPB47_028120 [Ixodes persulcatus]|uniref:Uncharacterized protein n=1 Tax=Ixodes persulcatus TaxID=34615 RepID=A0AC60PUL7_IXOPE|nr:hypothetical protein HPB47_028120 [Ixodes persulcatus]
MRVQILSFLDILRDECKDSCPYMAYKNAPEVPEAFEDSKKDWADSDPYCALMNWNRADTFGNIPDRVNTADLPQNHGVANGQQQRPAKRGISVQP